MLEARTQAIRKLLESCELDVLLFFHMPNVRYLCGFTGSDGALVASAERNCFLTDSRYGTQARRQVNADEIREYRLKLDEIAGLLGEWKLKRVGFESETLPYGVVERLRKKVPSSVELVPLEKELLPLRGRKTDREVAALRRAAEIAAEAFETIVPLVRPGVTEREIAIELEFALKRRGGEEKAFDFIVASGERGAMPHGVASNRPIASGELVTIDFGTRWEGYHSDETVTLAVGEVEPRLRTLFDTVLEAHDRAMAAVRPGIPLKEIDAVARDHIAGAGFGEYFGHGLGHGVGLEVHEYPTLNTRTEEVAAEGMVITIEPGIYIPEVGGVRIEDMLLVTEDGYRALTRIPKTYRQLPG